MAAHDPLDPGPGEGMVSGCVAFVDALAEWLPADGEPEPDAPWMAHAEGCPDCAALLDAERAAEARLRAALRAPVPDGLEQMVRDRLASAAPAPRIRSRRRVAMWLAAAMLLLGVGWSVGARLAAGGDAPLRARIVEGGGDIRAAGAGAPVRFAELAAGQVIRTTDGRAVVHHVDALLWLDPRSEIVVGATARGQAPAFELRRGAVSFAVAPGAPFVIDSAHGLMRTAEGTGTLRIITRESLQEDPMSPKSIALALGGVGAAAAIYLAVQSGGAELSNPGGQAAIAAGEQGVSADGRAPGRVATDQRVRALEAEVTELRRARDAERAKAERLEARIEVLTSGEGGAKGDDEVVLRPKAEVRADLAKLMKDEGLQIMALGPDHPLIKELGAMGPEGIALLGDMLSTGDQNERFGAAALMEKLMDPAAIPLLEDAIFSGDNEGNLLVQRMASHALGKIGGEKAVPVLERVVAEGSEWGVRTNAAYSLAEMGRQSGIDWLRDAYHTQDDPTARMMLLGVMAQVGDPSYLPDLHRVLQEETEYSKRFTAVTGIAKAARTESLSVLEGIINDPNEDKMIVNEARKAYDEIKGQE